MGSVEKRPSFFTLPSPHVPIIFPQSYDWKRFRKFPGALRSHGADDVSIDRNSWFSTPTNGESPWKR